MHTGRQARFRRVQARSLLAKNLPGIHLKPPTIAPKTKTEATITATIPHQPTSNTFSTQGLAKLSGPSSAEVSHRSRSCSQAHTNRLHSCSANTESGVSSQSRRGSIWLRAFSAACRLAHSFLPNRHASATSAEGAGRRGNFLSYCVDCRLNFQHVCRFESHLHTVLLPGGPR